MTDRNIWWARKRIYVPFAHRSYGGPLASTLTAFNTAASGFKITAVGTALEFVIAMPTDFNPHFPMGFRAHWGAIGTPATMGNASWIALAIFKKKTEAIITAATGALDTPWTLVQTPPAANAQTFTSRGIKNFPTLVRGDVYDGLTLQASVELDAVSGTIDATNSAFLFGLELDYVPMKTRFPHSEYDCPVDDASI